jgi:predicted Zn-dependent protease
MMLYPDGLMTDDRNAPPRKRELLSLLALFVGAFLVVVWLLNLLVGGVIGMIPPEAERQLGRWIIPALEAEAEDSTTQDRLNDLLDRLEAELPPEQAAVHDYQLLYIPDETVNAAAVPGDVILVYQGLLAEMESENELMMVLGHELGHFANRDHLRGLGREITLRLAIAIFLGDASALQSLSGRILNQVGSSRFSQTQETQADEFGLTLLHRTYGHVAGATDFFARLAETPGANVQFLASHPAPGKRVKDIKALIQQNGYTLGQKVPLNLDLE